MKTFEVIKRIVGEVHPVGETNTDTERLSNLKTMIEVTELLVSELIQVAKERKSHQHSVKNAGLYAAKALEFIYEEIGSIEI